MRFDAVIFDLDGTLTESEPGITKSVQYALEKMNYPVPERETLRRFIGPPLLESFEGISGMGEEEAERAVSVYRERFTTVGWKENSVYPGIYALLRALKKNGCYVAVATGKPLPSTRKILDYFALTPLIDRIEAIQPTDHHADKPALVRRALPRNYKKACMVGDRAGDMEGAKANAIEGVGALYGYGTEEELVRAGASFLAKDVNALADLLLDGAPRAGGVFMTFEGIDGCGKTTQMRRAADWLASCGLDVVTSREPGGCPISERIRNILLDVSSAGMTAECEALLYAAARAQHVHDVIRPALERGQIVLCDRFLDSSLAYQGAGRGLGAGLVTAINAPAVGNIVPDRVLLYALSPEKARQRRLAAREPDRMELEKDIFSRKLAAAFNEQAARNPHRYAVIDADRPVDDVEEDTRLAITQALSDLKEDT